MIAAAPLPAGFCDWLRTQANGPGCDIVDLGDGRMLWRVQGRDDPVGDLGAAPRWSRDAGREDPVDVLGLVDLAVAERATHGQQVFRSDVERAVRDALYEFARIQRRPAK